MKKLKIAKKDIASDSLNIYLDKIDRNEVYLFQVEVGDMPLESVGNLLTRLRECLLNSGVDGIFVPIRKGYGKIYSKKLKEYIQSHHIEMLAVANEENTDN